MGGRWEEGAYRGPAAMNGLKGIKKVCRRITLPSIGCRLTRILSPTLEQGPKYHRLDVTNQVIQTGFAQYHHGTDTPHSIEHGNGTQNTPTCGQLSTNRGNPVKRPRNNWQCTSLREWAAQSRTPPAQPQLPITLSLPALCLKSNDTLCFLLGFKWITP